MGSMELQALKLLITDEDLGLVAARAAEHSSDDNVSDLKVRITPAAVVVSGVYHMMMRVSFETFWTPSVRDGRLAATLSDLRVVGFGAGLLKGVLLRILGDEAAKEDAVKIEGDTVLIDVERLLAKNGLTLRAQFRAVRVCAGQPGDRGRNRGLACAAPGPALALLPPRARIP